MLRHLVNQEGIILFMATIGLTFFLEGLGEMIWGSNVKRLDIGIPDQPVEFGGILLNSFRHGRRRDRGGVGRRAGNLLPGRPASGARCGRSRTTIRRRCRSAFR